MARFFQRPEPEPVRPGAGTPPAVTPEAVFVALVVGARLPGELADVFGIERHDPVGMQTLTDATCKLITQRAVRPSGHGPLLLPGEVTKPGDGPNYPY